MCVYLPIVHKKTLYDKLYEKGGERYEKKNYGFSVDIGNGNFIMCKLRRFGNRNTGTEQCGAE